jgi:hypothetical protein
MDFARFGYAVSARAVDVAEGFAYIFGYSFLILGAH